MCPHYVRVGQHQNRNLERPLFWNNVYLVYVRNTYGLQATKTETLTGHYFGFKFKWQSFTTDALPANILTAHLVEHVEEHGESIVKPDLTGPVHFIMKKLLI